MTSRARILPFLWGFVLVVCAVWWGCTPRATAQTPSTAPSSGALGKFRGATLRIGTDATYPPLESLDGDKFVGFDIELGEAIAREMGAKVQWVNTSFDGIFPALLANKFDMVMSSVTITDERRKRLAFSTPYYLAGQIIAVRGNETVVTKLADLRGKQAGIQINTTAAEVLKPETAITVRKYPSIDLALQDLQNGNIAGVVGDAPTVRYYIAHGFKSLRTVGALLTQEHYGIVMRPQDRELQSAVDGALTSLRANGQFGALERKYFGATAERAEEARAQQQAKAGFPWRVVLPTLARGLVLTLALTLTALLVGIPLGLALALGRRATNAILRAICAIYVEVLRGTPLLVQIIFVYYALPQLIGLNLPPFQAALLALSANSAAYVCEIFRAGIGGVDIGQTEAARSLGLSGAATMRYVVIPQALRRSLPPLTNEAIAMLKDSSLVSVISMVELTRSGQDLVSQYATPLPIWSVVAVFYLAVTLPLTRLAAQLERRWERK